MVDDKFAEMSEDILEAIRSIGGERPKYLINTHFHRDHTGVIKILAELAQPSSPIIMSIND